MKNRIVMELRVVIVTGLMLGLLALVSNFVSSLSIIKSVSGVPCIYQVINDLNGNGQFDSGEKTITLQNLQIQVDDPQGSDSGTYAASDCYLTPTAAARTMHLHFTLPPTYKAVSPLDMAVNIFEDTHFSDYPPHLTLFVQRITP